jgi:hypothetical protein
MVQRFSPGALFEAKQTACGWYAVVYGSYPNRLQKLAEGVHMWHVWGVHMWWFEGGDQGLFAASILSNDEVNGRVGSPGQPPSMRHNGRLLNFSAVTKHLHAMGQGL